MSGTDLLRAAAEGDVASVRSLLTAGTDPNARDARGMTPLMLAAWRGHEEVAGAILEHAPDLSPRAHDGWRALTYASANTFERPDGTRTQILRALIDAGDRPQPGRADWKALHYAAEWGNAEAVRLLVEHGMDPDVRDDAGLTPLMRAARKGKAESVQILLDRGADPAVAGPAGETALDLARARKRKSVIALLENRG